jgi:hypothetical protein
MVCKNINLVSKNRWLAMEWTCQRMLLIRLWSQDSKCLEWVSKRHFIRLLRNLLGEILQAITLTIWCNLTTELTKSSDRVQVSRKFSLLQIDQVYLQDLSSVDQWRTWAKTSKINLWILTMLRVLTSSASLVVSLLKQPSLSKPSLKQLKKQLIIYQRNEGRIRIIIIRLRIPRVRHWPLGSR